MNAVTAVPQYNYARSMPMHTCGVKCGHGGENTSTIAPATAPTIIKPEPLKSQPAFLTGMTTEEITGNKLSFSKRFGLGMIALYQWVTRKISPNGGIQNKYFTCNCNPSCSVYTAESIKQHGLFKGSYMGLKQIMTKCYPFAPVMEQYGFKQGIPLVIKAIAYEMGLTITNTKYKEAYEKVQSSLKH